MRDLVEISRSPGPLALFFVAPVVLLLLIGNLKARDPVLRVAVVAARPAEGTGKPAHVDQLEAALREIASLEVMPWDPADGVLRERAVRDNVDLVIVWENGGWRFRTPLTNSYRQQFAQVVAQDLALSLQRGTSGDEHLASLGALARELPVMRAAPSAAVSSAPSATASSAASAAASSAPSAAASSAASAAASSAASEQAQRVAASAKAMHLVETMTKKARDEALVPTPVLRAWLANRLEFYFPAASHVDRSLVPGFIALIAVFLPFLLASSALVREREAGTFETLIIIARRNWARVAAAKLLMPVVIAMLTTVLLLVAARTAFGFGIKPGLVAAFGVQLIAAATSAILGLAISTLLKSSQDAYTMASAYLIASILLTGMVYPVEQAATAVAAVSYLFPLTLSGAPPRKLDAQRRERCRRTVAVDRAARPTDGSGGAVRLGVAADAEAPLTQQANRPIDRRASGRPP
jgi:ABC-type multidrug transport system permease subunit